MTRATDPTRPVGRRWGAAGAAAGGLLGAVVGLIVGLHAHPATAWFAVFEVGIPAAVVGGIIGLAAGAIASAFRRTAPGALEPPSSHCSPSTPSRTRPRQ